MSLSVPNDSKAAALDAVHRLFDSKVLSGGERQRSLLRYLVSEEIEGRGAAIKAVSIAQDVFGRGAEFDPQTDSIVRVEIGRLRKALALYYATDGRNDPVEIVIAKGGYRPSVALRVERAEQDVLSRRKQMLAGLLALVVLAFGLSAFVWLRGSDPASTALVIGVFKPEIGTLDKSQEFLKAGIRAEFIALLSHSPELAVVPIDVEPGTDMLQRYDFLVRSSIQIINGRAVVQIALQGGEAMRTLLERKEEVQLDIGDLFALQASLAANLAQAVGRPYGLIGQRAMSAAHAGHKTEINCYFLALRYFEDFAPADRKNSAACLGQLNRGPGLTAYGKAALAYMDMLSTRYGADNRSWPAALTAFEKISGEAYAAEPNHWLVRSSRFTSALCRGDVPAFRQIALSAVESTPANPALLSDVATKLVMGADAVEEGLELLERAEALNPVPQPWYGLPRAAIAILDNRPKDANSLLSSIRQTDFPEVALLRLIAAGEAGDATGLLEARKRLVANRLADKASLLQLLERSCWSPRMIAAFRPKIENLRDP